VAHTLHDELPIVGGQARKGFSAIQASTPSNRRPRVPSIRGVTQNDKPFAVDFTNPENSIGMSADQILHIGRLVRGIGSSGKGSKGYKQTVGPFSPCRARLSRIYPRREDPMEERDTIKSDEVFNLRFTYRCNGTRGDTSEPPQ
jgi:hypothetical protein